MTKIGQVEQEIKEKLDRSASNKLDRPTSEMPGKHQPSAFSTKIFSSKSMYFMVFVKKTYHMVVNTQFQILRSKNNLAY